jgi:RNA polymerase sigma factor (sigma-70 family)
MGSSWIVAGKRPGHVLTLTRLLEFYLDGGYRYVEFPDMLGERLFDEAVKQRYCARWSLFEHQFYLRVSSDVFSTMGSVGGRRYMATPVRASADCSAKALQIDALANALCSVRGSDDGGPGRPLLGGSAVQHGSTDRGVARLAVGLSRHDAASSDPDAAGFEEVELSEAADEDSIAEPASGLAWLFGDEPELPPLRAGDDVVGLALEDLLGDRSRRGGQLTRADVALLVSTRGLTPIQHGELLDLLCDEGVELPDLTSPRPGRAGEQGYEFHGDAVKQYLRAISRYRLIDGPREIELWSLISQGAAARCEAGDDPSMSHAQRSLEAQIEAGRRAHAELVCANLRLVVSIAKARHYESCGVEFLDRIQDGNLGLMHAADKFDGSKGFKFSTYATWWIMQSIDRGIGDRGSTIRVPIHFQERARKVRAAMSRLTLRLDHQPTLAEIADATGMESGEVQAVLDLSRSVVSLDLLLGDEGDLRLSDVLVDEDDRDGRTDPAEIVAHAMMREDVTRTLAEVLPARNAQIIERRFGMGTGDGETLDEIGPDFGVTRERIRQIQVESMTKLRLSRCVAPLRAYVADGVDTGRVGAHPKGNGQ